MKLILTPNDQAVAIQAFLIETYNIATVIDESQLVDMNIDLDPVASTVPLMRPTEPNRALLQEIAHEDANIEKDLDAQSDYRDKVIREAEGLGIKFRSDIKTETLEERIEEYCQEREELFTEANAYGLGSLESFCNDDIQRLINEQIDINRQEDTEVIYEAEELAELPEPEDTSDGPIPVPEMPKKKSIFGN